jgi:hypothetical protein
MQTGFLILMRYMPRVDKCFHLEVALFHGSELLMDLPVVEKPAPAISMNCDNQTVIIKINSSKDNMKSTRHIKRRLKSVRKLRNSRVIVLDYVNTSKNLADQFTKGISRSVIDSASSEMGLRPT